MAFPTVKSDPYKKGTKPRRRRFALWSEAFWGQLLTLGSDKSLTRDLKCRNREDLSERQLAAIRAENARLYGAAA